MILLKGILKLVASPYIYMHGYINNSSVSHTHKHTRDEREGDLCMAIMKKVLCERRLVFRDMWEKVSLYGYYHSFLS